MSRHICFTNARWQVVAGWDNSMGTYFMHVYDLLNEDDELFWGIGQDYDEIATVDVLYRKAGVYQKYLTPEIITKLRSDRADRQPLTPLQERTRKLFNE